MKRKKQNKKWIGFIVALIAVIAPAVVIGIVVSRQGDLGSEQRQEEQTQESEERKETEDSETEVGADVVNAELKSTGVEKEKVVQYEGEDPNKAADLSGVITRADVTGQNLVIRVNIDQYLGSGKCELSLVRGGASIYTASANIVGVATTSTCEGFDVPVSALGGGDIQINIKISADGREGVIRGEVNI